jgi:hypothetical protein
MPYRGGGDRTIERGFWQHLSTGKVWAVETEDEKPIQCVGPLDVRDVDEALLLYLGYSTRYLDVVRAEWNMYVRYVLCSVCGTVLRPGAATAPNGGAGRVHVRCSLTPPPIQGDSVGAALLVESVWQRNGRLRHTSRALRRNSERLQARGKSARATYVLPLVT